MSSFDQLRKQRVELLAGENWVELEGVARSGIGEGTGLTRLEWVQQQFLEKLGMKVYPGTFNLEMSGTAWQKTLAEIKRLAGVEITPPEGYCRAKCFPVLLENKIRGVLILPEVSDYPAEKFEVIAEVSVTDSLSVEEGSRIKIYLQLDDTE